MILRLMQNGINKKHKAPNNIKKSLYSLPEFSGKLVKNFKISFMPRMLSNIYIITFDSFNKKIFPKT